VPRDAWHENMVSVAEYLDLDADDREDKVPYVWALDAKQQLSRLLVDDSMIRSAEERRQFWVMLRDLAASEEEAPVVDETGIESRVRQEVVQKIASGLLGLVAGGEPVDLAAVLDAGEAPAPVAKAPAATPAPQAAPQPKAAPEPAAVGDYMAPWIDTEECTACDECVIINPQIFAYNADKKAYIVNPDGGPYRDLVKSAEKCTAQIIHPGLPRDRSAKDINKWIKRGQKFN
jgi:pyruvate-ferredoxin/flavodoxin oxidoreductase